MSAVAPDVREARPHLRPKMGREGAVLRLKMRRRVAALALWMDVLPVDADSAAWAFVEATFARRATLRPPGRPIGQAARTERRTLEALRLRYVEGMTFDEVGARLRPAVSVERARTIVERGVRVLRSLPVFYGFRAAVAMDLDDATAPPEARRPAGKQDRPVQGAPT